MTDFGAEKAFAGAARKLKEHYGMVVPVSAVREITDEHGATMLAQEKQKSDGSDRPGVPRLIVEMDRSMLPVVDLAEPGSGEAVHERRKTRQVSWKEARLAMAHPPGSVGSPRQRGFVDDAQSAGVSVALALLPMRVLRS